MARRWGARSLSPLFRRGRRFELTEGSCGTGRPAPTAGPLGGPDVPGAGPLTGVCAAVYIHIPFCRARCAYCDFATTTGLEALIPRYLKALEHETDGAARRWGRLRVPSIYFGGGTPSLVPSEGLSAVLECLRACFAVAPDAEITLEASPGTVSRSSLEALRSMGVNRISLGVQSASDRELARLGRIHTWAAAVEAVTWARAAGFTNLSLDLIYGLPHQSMRRWRETLDAVLGLEPDHLSLYALSVEPGTPLAERIRAGEMPPPDEDRAAEMALYAEERLASAGFWHYEISNWARAAQSRDGQGHAWWPAGWCGATEALSPFVCRHNLVYWRNEPWLGLGAAAHSWLGGTRWANRASPLDYTRAVEEGASPVAEREVIPARLEMGETMMLGLRLAEGVSDERFRARFGVGLVEAFGTELADLVALGLLGWDGRAARLTERGRLLGNQVFVRFV